MLLKITEVSLSIQTYLVPYGLTSHTDDLFRPMSLDSHNLILRLLTIPVDQFSGGGVRRQNLVDLKLPELRETLAHQVVLMLITVMHLLAERQGL